MLPPLVSRIVLNAVTSWGATLVRAVLSFAVIPIVLGALGKEAYGITGVAASIVVFARAADFGLRRALGRELTELATKEKDEDFNRVASTALVFYVGLGLFLVAVIQVTAPTLAQMFNVPAHLMASTVLLFRTYSSVAVMTAFVRPIYEASVISANRHDVVSAVDTGAMILNGVALILAMMYGEKSLLVWSSIMIGTRCFEVIAIRFAAHRIRPSFEIRLGYAARASLAPILGLSSLLFLEQVAAIVGLESAPFILTTFIGPAAVTYYVSAYALTSAFRPIVYILGTQLHPVATALHAKSDTQKLKRVLIDGTKYTYLMAIPPTVLLLFFGESICNVWLGEKLGPSVSIVGKAVVVWSVYQLFYYLSGTQWPVLVATNKLGRPIIVKSMLALVDVGFSIFLVATTDLGVLGVIYPSLVIGVLLRVLVTWWASAAINLPVSDYLREAYARPTAALALHGSVTWLLARSVQPTTWLEVLAYSVVVGLLSLPILWWVGLDEPSRTAVARVVRGVANRLLPNRS